MFCVLCCLGHVISRYYEPFKHTDPSAAPKTAVNKCAILDERTCLDGTCLLLSDMPAGDLYDNDLRHTARYEAGFALCVLGDCEIMNGDLVEYNMNSGDNPDHVLKATMMRRLRLMRQGTTMVMAMTIAMTTTTTMTKILSKSGRAERSMRMKEVRQRTNENKRKKSKKSKTKMTSQGRKAR